MATDLFREAPFGQLVRAITKNKVFAYPEEQPNFEGLEFYRGGSKSQSGKALADVVENKEETEAEVRIPDYARQQSTPMSSSEESLKEKQHLPSLALHPTERPPHVPERHDVERNLEVEKTTSKPILPLTTNDGTILVDWYYTDDPANPQNWSKKKKAFVALQIDLYTLVVYAGSAIYVSSQPAVVEAFGIGYLEAALGLATFLVVSCSDLGIFRLITDWEQMA